MVTWGHAHSGGRIPSQVRAELKNVKEIYSTGGAFAALLENGSVVAWGDADWGGRIPDNVKAELKKQRAELNEEDRNYPDLQQIIDANWDRGG